MAIVIVCCPKSEGRALIGLWCINYGTKSPGDEIEDLIEVGRLIHTLKKETYICKYFDEEIHQAFIKNERVIVVALPSSDEIVKFITVPGHIPSVSVKSSTTDSYETGVGGLRERMEKDDSLVALVILSGTSHVTTYELKCNHI